ncbi:MAG TPA: CHAP domain-containing protein [Ktedonobacteraceae bacterium]|nr:CHAP domain-containing protein [Ktedonobacteraceae bacterium]
MLPAQFWQTVHRGKVVACRIDRRFAAKLIGVFFLVVIICIEAGPLLGHAASAQISSLDHTSPTVDSACRQVRFTTDGNPFPLCPGINASGALAGGNCTWWAWEQWHLLGFDLPRNWGNAADWIVDAERDGLPMGTTPRVGAIAVFPRGDGVWAYSALGHLAFVTSVSAAGTTFNVTYQNYGDATTMLIGVGYNVTAINEPRFQNGELRFLYFPRLINSQAFGHLAGVNGANYQPQVMETNALLTSGPNGTSNQIALGLPTISSDQQFNADFTGNGLSDILLYNRAQGSLQILTLSNTLYLLNKSHVPRSAYTYLDNLVQPQLVSLSDATTPVNGWGSSLEIHIGDFTGAGVSDILMYDRVKGTIQFISLTPQLKIKQHVTLSGFGTGWEINVGNFDGTHSTVFMYNRLINAAPIVSETPTPTPPGIPGTGNTPTPGTTPTVTPSPTPGPTATPTTVVPCPTPVSFCPTPTPTSSPTPNPLPSPTAVTCLLLQSRKCHTPTPGSGQPVLNPQQNPDGSLAPGSKGTSSSSSTLSGGGGGGGSGSSGSVLDGGGGGSGNGGLPGSSSLKSNVIVFNVNQHFAIKYERFYTLADNAWEVYVGPIVSTQQDGLFLYDRIQGNGLLLSFGSTLFVAHKQTLNNLNSNWEVFTGSFSGSGQAQVLLYDPSSGDAEILVLSPALVVTNTQTYSSFSTNQVLYVGHFGLPTVSIMFYDPQVQQSTFVAFDATLAISHQVTVASWDQHYQVLVGAFIDRSRCLATHSCTTGDDILVLNRQTGQMEQYVFSFGNQYSVYDNHSQPFDRKGIASQPALVTVDASVFSLLNTLSTSIRNEELY